MSSKKGRRKNDELLPDVTVNTYANSKKSGRIKKSAITNDINVLVESDDEADYCKRTSRNRRRHSEIPIDERKGFDYPFDVWFAISEHVRPEDIGSFAGINKTTLAVTSSPKFWFNLYKKFYVKDAKLPQRLRPECMVRLYCLRQCVIRTLYFSYEPFINRLKVHPNGVEPHNLVTRRCVMMWYKKYKNNWMFFFKLKVVNHVRYRSDFIISNDKADLCDVLQNHLANDEEECKIMQVICESFCEIPMVMGMVLSSVNLSQGVLLHRLQVGFRSGIYSKGLLPESVIILDNVTRIQVLDWWHPNYPHYKSPLPVSNRPDEDISTRPNLQSITD